MGIENHSSPETEPGVGRSGVKSGSGLSDIKADAELDARGLFCPMPAVKLKLRLEEMEIGQILEVLATDVGTKEDIPAWCDSTGNDFVGFSEESESNGTAVIKLFVRKGTEA